MSSSDNRKLMDHVQQVLRVKHYAISTEKTYYDWIRQYVKFHKMQGSIGSQITDHRSQIIGSDSIDTKA